MFWSVCTDQQGIIVTDTMAAVHAQTELDASSIVARWPVPASLLPSRAGSVEVPLLARRLDKSSSSMAFDMMGQGCAVTTAPAIGHCNV